MNAKISEIVSNQSIINEILTEKIETNTTFIIFLIAVVAVIVTYILTQ